MTAHFPEFEGAEGKAVSQLKRMRVWKVMDIDDVRTFEDVWYRVAHEVDMYEDSDDYDAFIGSCPKLTEASYRTAKAWMERYESLCRG